VNGIESKEYVLSKYYNSTVSATQLLNIYSARARSLERRISANEIKGVHPERLLEDTEQFVEELAAVPDEKVNFWAFSIDGSSSYTVFVGVNKSRILGCLLTVDKGKVSENEWDELWGKDR
jgi:hypothetical protein